MGEGLATILQLRATALIALLDYDPGLFSERLQAESLQVVAAVQRTLLLQQSEDGRRNALNTLGLDVVAHQLNQRVAR